MATHASETGDERSEGLRPRPFGLLLIGIGDFLGAVGVGNVVLGQPALLWLLIAGAMLLWGIAACD
ncbi:MAG TPA: hypothetical protein VLR26_03800 [Frankiaceae bacterium]|nr:hypothetical protein [Frankiaceae bacterium]